MLKKNRQNKILVVEDDQDNRILTSKILDTLGFEVATAQDGLAALDILAARDISIVITDISMPRMDGMQLLEHISGEYPDVDVIVMTGHTKEFSFSKVIEAGAIDYLGKPFQADELKAKLTRCLRERDLIQALQKEAKKRQDIERNSARQQQFITNALNALTYPFYVIDAKDFTIKMGNTASGYQPNSNARQTCHSLTHKSDTPCNSTEHPCPLRVILQTKKPFSVEHIHFDKDGNERNVDVHAYPLFDEHGNVAQIIEYSLDITDRKNAEEKLRLSEQRYRHLVEGTSDLITQVDAQGRFTYINHVAQDIFGYMPEECLGKPLFDFVHPDDRSNTETWFRDTIKNRQEHMSCESRQVNQITGAVIHMRWTRTFHYDQDGVLQLVNSIGTDISNRIKLESELKRAKESAEKAAQLKSEFLANMSHEIRTPLNVILGMNRLALDTNLTSDQRHYLSAVQQNSQSLMHLINDILDLSKIEAGQLTMQYQAFNLNNLLQSTIHPLNVIATDKGLKLHYKIADNLSSVFVVGDEHRLRQILINLINNAIKFTDAGHIQVTIKQISQQGSQLFMQCSVADTGPGIAESMHKNIFNSFTQADSSVTRQLGGSGLGLAICKKLVKLMGGEIWLESKPGKGSIFYFTFTVQKANRHAAVNSVARTADSDKKALSTSLHILLAEDNKFNRDLAKIVLENQGHTVSVAVSGLDALRVLVTDNFDIILMDVQMPELDGISATRIIRQCEQNEGVNTSEHMEVIQKLHKKCSGQRIPIVAMTAHAMAGDREKCLAVGMDDYVTKPFQPDELQAVLMKIAHRAD